MANDLNRHECIGRLGQDPELKYQTNGSAVANISVACSSSWKDKTTGQKQEKTEWVRYVAYDKLAEIIVQYLKKGSKIYISGELRTREWTDQQNVKRQTTEIVANAMQMLDGRGDGQRTEQALQPRNQQSQYPAPAHSAPQQPAGFDSFDDDIPF
jgi:single-strand DNA-binding protein